MQKKPEDFFMCVTLPSLGERNEKADFRDDQIPGS